MCRLWVVVTVLLITPANAFASQLVDRNAAGVKLTTNTKGEALLTYRKGGRIRHVLVWGAINAEAPRKGARQERFKLDYAGGYGKYHKPYWKTFRSSCGHYDGPSLPNVVAACKSFDGSYWVAQSWPQPLPDLGFAPWTAQLRAKWLEVSHWSGPIATFETGTAWVYSGRFQMVFGRVMYNGAPVHGFGTTRVGAPTDGFGRLVFLDTLNSTYGPGWKRENSFVPHNPTGVFCYGFYSFDPTKGGYRHPPAAKAKRGPGTGTSYRLTLPGPGVTPNVAAIVPGLHAFDKSNPDDVAYQQAQAALLRSWGDRGCAAGL
jgi:hypothetical protein